MRTKIFIILLFCCSAWTANRATAQHFLGVSSGYGINSLQSSIYENLYSTRSWVTYSIIYKYYDPKWTGLQISVNYTERGFQRDSTMKRMYQIIEAPVVTQFHYELWKLRAVGSAGLYAAYALSANETRLYPEPGPTEEYTFRDTDRRFDYGLRFGGGVGVMLQPVEVLFEFNYVVGLGHIHDPASGYIHDTPRNWTTYRRFSQMAFSLGVLIAL